MRKIFTSYILVPLAAYLAYVGLAKGVCTAGDLIEARKATR
jgi:hypothetical protein